MDYWNALDHPVPGVHLGQMNLSGHNAPVSSLPSGNAWPGFAANTGHNSAGNGGNGHFSGSMIHSSYASFEPLNVAQAGYHAAAGAYQTNVVYLDQSATQVAGVGGDGGNGNTASGGNVSAFGSVHGGLSSGRQQRRQWRRRHLLGSLVHAPVVVYAPVNVAVAGANSTAEAHQTNVVHFDQSATQMAGIRRRWRQRQCRIGRKRQRVRTRPRRLPGRGTSRGGSSAGKGGRRTALTAISFPAPSAFIDDIRSTLRWPETIHCACRADQRCDDRSIGASDGRRRRRRRQRQCRDRRKRRYIRFHLRPDRLRHDRDRPQQRRQWRQWSFRRQPRRH